MQDFQYERAVKASKMLVKTSKKRGVCTYKELGEYIGIHPHVVQYPLHILQRYCLQKKLPPLTILAISSVTGKQSEGFYASRSNEIKRDTERVYQYDWDKVDFSFSAIKDVLNG